MNRTGLLKRGLYLEYATLAWNVAGVVIVFGAAFVANSVALAGFGIDSLIEIFASLVVVWQLKGIHLNRERLALKLIGSAFFVLALYILIQSGNSLLTQTRPGTSLPGLFWLTATFMAMLALAWGKNRTGKALGNQVLLTEGRVTLIDAYLAGAVLIGLALNLLFQWWWADPLAGLVILFYSLKEGWHAWHEAK
jgi:divalent metal cation (Fe/Co/Zn/Cd) transporter